ncbi:MAG: hypothetical protein QOE90_1486 [Thermoplasmata archaeon]|nr:hypothetical protein [Thermoplasmata archaeon]
MLKWASFSILVLAALIVCAGCLRDPTDKIGPLQHQGRLEFSTNGTLFAHLDFYNAADEPVHFPHRAFDPKEPTAEAAIDTLVNPTRESNGTIHGKIIYGPTGKGLGKSFLFNASDVIGPHSWWNTTFEIGFDQQPEPSWRYEFSATVTYFVGDDTAPWHWEYWFPCYDGAGELIEHAPGCDETIGTPHVPTRV